MKRVLFLLLCISSPLLADSAKFASQTDLVGDLSDTLLNGIYRHHLSGCQSCFEACDCGPVLWLQGFGNYRNRSSNRNRSCYDEWFGGILGGIETYLSSNCYLNFLIGGSWGEIEIDHESRDINTDSFFLGATLERICNCHFFGFALIGGILTEDRYFNNIREKPQGVFLTPEFTYATSFNCLCFPSNLRATVRYAGFFPCDYETREILGTFYIQERSIQLITVRGEFSPQLFNQCGCCLEPYIGIAGRFQVDGDRVKGDLLLSKLHVSDGIECSIGYGLVGIRGAGQLGCLCYQLNLEGSYDTDKSGRILGELSLNYAY